MPDAANLAQLCREAAAYAADMGQDAWAEALRAAAVAAEELGECEAEQMRVDLTATALEYDLVGVGE
jgi:hypothetical protein